MNRTGVRSTLALVQANVRYWHTVAPVVREQLAHWEQRAREIDDPPRRSLALGKLRAERFNPQLAATLATLAPRLHRRAVTEAIVALQVAYDYLDAVDERYMGVGDDPYARELLALVVDRARRLPATPEVWETAQVAAERCRLAQAHGHRASGSQDERLRLWASAQATGTSLEWPEWLAGAQASVLSLHALIAAAADSRTTRDDAQALDRAYLRIGALTMLDSLIDHEEDEAGEALRYAQLYTSAGRMADRLACVAREAIEQTRGLRDGAHHHVTAGGIVAYYASSPSAREGQIKEVFTRVRRELDAPLPATLAVMRVWRVAKRARERAKSLTPVVCRI